MNEMYNMSIGIHYYSVMIVVLMIIVNILHVKSVSNISNYVRSMRFIMPGVYSILSVVIFTGVVMMAAKHLDFTIQNIVMIIFSVAFIVLDIKRYKPLKYIRAKDYEVFELYRSKAVNILLLELVVTLLISAWMLV
jgi:hypothetical protein